MKKRTCAVLCICLLIGVVSGCGTEGGRLTENSNAATVEESSELQIVDAVKTDSEQEGLRQDTAEQTDWKQAYLAKAEELETKENPLSYVLIYLDADDIPELVAKSFFDGGFYLYTWKDGEVCELINRTETARGAYYYEPYRGIIEKESYAADTDYTIFFKVTEDMESTKKESSYIKRNREYISGQYNLETFRRLLKKSYDLWDQEEWEHKEPAEGRAVDLTDYRAYLKKIWIVEGWNLAYDGDTYPISLVITQMEEGYIRGYLEIGHSVTYNYMNLDIWKDKTPEFEGMIYDGTAECEYDYKDGREGTLAITFCENDRIEVELDGNKEQRYLLRPYNISDEEFCDEPTFHEVELDSWGTVTLCYATYNARHPYPWVLLLNEQGDILYRFTGFINGSEVSEVIIEDMNGDGLQDVEIVTCMSDSYWDKDYYYQMQNGLFYKDWSSFLTRLDEGGVEILLESCKSAFGTLFYGQLPIEPDVCQVGENLLEVSMSTGNPARYVFYIDKEYATTSDIYFNPILVGDEYVAYMQDGKLIFSDIFYTDVENTEQLYLTIIRDFTQTADPISAIISIEMPDSENIELTYYTGEDYTEVTEIIPINIASD